MITTHERPCPDCGCPSVASDEKIKGRRVFGCSNPGCGLDHIRIAGGVEKIRYAPRNTGSYRHPRTNLDLIRNAINLLNLARGDLRLGEHLYLLQLQDGKLLDYIVCMEPWQVTIKARELSDQYQAPIYACCLTSPTRLPGQSFLAWAWANTVKEKEHGDRL